jgi:AcrR family transcriptional regulator
VAARSSYPKGVRKREEILDVALEVFADEGYRGTSLRTVASRCGLTVGGVMHYFDSREDLLTQIVDRRDRASREIGRDREYPRALVDVMRENAKQPGLVELFVSLTAAARHHDHPAHDVLARRYTDLRSRLARAIVEGQERGEIPPYLNPDDLARLIVAVADGAQLQWMVDDLASLDGPLVTLLHDILRLPRE